VAPSTWLPTCLRDRTEPGRRAAQTHETGKAFATGYRRRAGIEGTLLQGIRAMHLRRTYCLGLVKAARSTCSRLPLWTSAALAPGSQAHHVQEHANPPSSGLWPCQPPPDDFASRLTARGAHHHGEEMRRRIVGWQAALNL